MTRALPAWTEGLVPIDMDGAAILLGVSRRFLFYVAGFVGHGGMLAREMRMEKTDSLGDYLKGIEGIETGRRGAAGQAVYIRIDGNRFSKFTRGMQRPFDPRMSAAMIDTAKGLVTEFGAALGYTQSDEISLVLWEPKTGSELAHGGKFQKLASRTASKATHLFYKAAMARGLEEFVARQFPEFDARAFAVSLDDAAKAIYWREIDARKNAIQMAAGEHFSHKALHKKHGDDQLAMLREVGVDFDAFPAYFRRGTLIKRVNVCRETTAEELERIPPQYRPTGPINRTDVVEVPMPEMRGADDRVALLFSSTARSSLIQLG